MKKSFGYLIIALFIYGISFVGALAEGNNAFRALLLAGIGFSFALAVAVITLILIKACIWICENNPSK